jgi:hypothetical protein
VPYVNQFWLDLDISTPLSAERLNHIESGIVHAVRDDERGLIQTALADQLILRSEGAFRGGLQIDNITGSQQSVITFYDAGTAKWQIGKAADDDFELYDFVRARPFLVGDTASGDLVMQPSGGKVSFGGSDFVVDPVGGSITLSPNMDLMFEDGSNIQAGITDGTQIGTSSTQKLGFWGVVPVTQPAAYTIEAPTFNRTYDVESVSMTEIAQVLATVITDLQSMGLFQQV